jgi:phytol kinase
MALAWTFFALLVIGLWLLGPKLAPDGRRKLFHVGAGVIAMALPWLLVARWCAIVVLSVTVAALLALRYVQGLRATLGDALHGVARRSYGEFYFAAAVLVLLLRLPHGGLVYDLPIAILTVADPMAAIVGMSRGRQHLGRWAAQKTTAGCVACFESTVLVVSVGLRFGGWSPVRAVLVAGVVAIAVTAAEAIAPGGSDNLLIPVVANLVLAPLLVGDFLNFVPITFVVASAARVTMAVLQPEDLRLEAAARRHRN